MNISPMSITPIFGTNIAGQSTSPSVQAALPQGQVGEDRRFDRLVKNPFEREPLANIPGAKTIDGKTVSDINEDKSCKTCKSRTYQDGSDDPSVSFKSPTSVPVGSEGSAVMGHEREHVANETANAKNEGRKILSQAIRIYTAICPECKRVYVSGGTTTTVTAPDNKKAQNNNAKLDYAV